MALATYSDLQTYVTELMVREDLLGSAADWITLAEARLNREIPAVETDVTLTGVASSRRIDVSSYSVVSPLALFLIDTDGDDIEMVRKADGTFP